MTGYKSKRAAARDKLEDDDTQVYHDDSLTIAYQSGFYDAKRAAKRPWVGLTEQDRKEIMRYEKDFWGVSGWEWKCMEAIETKLKEKNT